MTKEEIAGKLNGREYGSEISEAEEAECKALGFVVIFGYSDDNVELRGAIDDEVSAYGGAIVMLHRGGVLAPHDHRCDCVFCGYEKVANKCAKVKALWCKEPGYSWTYKTCIPHATFEITEEGSHHCRGLVIDIKDLPEVL